MDAKEEKQALVAFGSVLLIGGLVFAIWGANMVSTASSCTSSFSCSLGATLNGTSLDRYYAIGQMIEMTGVVLGILGLVSVGYGLTIKPRVIQTGQNQFRAVDGPSIPNASLQSHDRFCTNCGSGRTAGTIFCRACGVRLS